MANTLKFGNGQWATKVGSTLAYNDENGNFKPLPFNFTRASSATRVNKQGLIETVASGVPRIDFTDANGALLLEPQRTNSLLQSNQFDTIWLNQLGGTITSGQSGYDGSSDAWLISKDTSTFRSVRQVVSWNGVSTFSVYAKEGSLSNAALRMDTGGGAIQILFNLSSGVATYSGGVLIDYGTENVGNGWWRLYITANVSSGTNVHIYVDRDGTTSGNILIQNAQLEVGSYATSYIPTQGATATRVADACSGAGNATVFEDVNASGVLYAEISALANEGGVRAISLNDGSTQNRISIRYNSTSNQIQYQYTLGNVVQASITYNVTDVTANHKIAIRWAVNDFELFIDGVSRGTDVSGNVMSSGTLTTLDINGSSVYDYMYAKIKGVQVLSYQSDAEMIALTSL
jgi:hypothetical protein